MSSKLGAAGVPVRGDIRTIETVNSGPGGRATEVQIVSTAFTATRTGDALKIEGRGWGHGVGLCQYGALGLAKRGKATREIVLTYWYLGAEFQQYR